VTIGSLFSGIGGLELGLEMCGLGPVRWQCEIDPAARAVLAEHWPGVRRYEDVRHIDEYAERVDIICGGFPCQDISDAGTNHTRRGVHGERSGLWREYARVIREVRPRAVFIENVASLAERGLGKVLSDLSSLGFDAEWGVFCGCYAGAPHARERMFVLAWADGESKSALAQHAEVAGVPAVAGAAGDRRAPPPGVLGVADGVPGEMDRLRLLGNSAEPPLVALAWRTLTQRLEPFRTKGLTEG